MYIKINFHFRSQDDLALLKPKEGNTIWGFGKMQRASISTDVLNRMARQPAFNFSPPWLNTSPTLDQGTPHLK